MVSYLSAKQNICGNHIPIPYQKLMQNDDEGSEIEFEGWLRLGDPIRERDMEFNSSCPRSCSMNSPNLHSCQNDNNFCQYYRTNNFSANSSCRNNTNRVCTHNSTPMNFMNRNGLCGNCRLKSNTCGRQTRNDNEIYYVNNRQSAPTVVVQKPQTVVVRNKSRPPIVVQQPPPNVIVKNDPPQPIYVQNCPPNITVKNSESPPFGNLSRMSSIHLNNQFERLNEPSMGRQSTCGMSRNQITRPTHKNHCIYHCKNPNYVNF